MTLLFGFLSFVLTYIAVMVTSHDIFAALGIAFIVCVVSMVWADWMVS